MRTAEEYAAWLKQVAALLGCGSCWAHWLEIAQDPRPEDPWWGFDCHNDVNARRGVERFTESQAISKYGWQPRQHDQAGQRTP